MLIYSLIYEFDLKSAVLDFYIRVIKGNKERTNERMLDRILCSLNESKECHVHSPFVAAHYNRIFLPNIAFSLVV